VIGEHGNVHWGTKTSETRTAVATGTAIATEVIETASENVIATVTVIGIVTDIAEMMFEKSAMLAAEVQHLLLFQPQC
jgi:phosphoribosyl-ATP pyrophosphohydrolase